MVRLYRERAAGAAAFVGQRRRRGEAHKWARLEVAWGSYWLAGHSVNRANSGRGGWTVSFVPVAPCPESELGMFRRRARRKRNYMQRRLPYDLPSRKSQ